MSKKERQAPVCPWCRCRRCLCSAMWGPSGATSGSGQSRITEHLQACAICREALLFCAACNDGGLLALLHEVAPDVDLRRIEQL